MRRIALITGLTLALAPNAIAGKKKKKKQDAPVAKAEPSPEIPGDATSKKFSKSLLTIPCKSVDCNPSDQLRYDSLVFSPDNTWTANGLLSLSVDMEDECVETGTWTMEAATEAHTAVVVWEVTSTDCIGRNIGDSTRAQVTIEKNGLHKIQKY